ncbi:hypothetical protein RKE29_02760 [Streptomyces sp. B1866]|uniref:hypothetical protein n=1 Tax=Streptomyces sp. B1866 TaxID=3075431 RepID=UPI00288CFCB1|nr:hypothetical protein [Streptomyces sp. B1866]MDT3395580.1 hypothetical protein [Streptomyces sp. B1866]
MDFIDLAVKVGTGALGGAAASLFLAGYVAQRQELGKQRAADLDALRSYTAQRLSYLALHWHRYSIKRDYPQQFLNDSGCNSMAVELVRLSLRLPLRRRRRIRQHLIAIFGELTTACAEEFAMTTEFDGTHAFIEKSRGTAWRMIPPDSWLGAQLSAMKRLGDVGGGTLRAFAESLHDKAKYDAVRRDFEALLRTVGGRPNFTERTRRSNA